MAKNDEDLDLGMGDYNEEAIPAIATPMKKEKPVKPEKPAKEPKPKKEKVVSSAMKVKEGNGTVIRAKKLPKEVGPIKPKRVPAVPYVRKTDRVYSRGESELYDFDVRREKISHAGMDLPYDLIYRIDGEKPSPISVVSPTYKMVTHKEAVGFIENLFEKLGLEYEVDRTAVISNGSMMSRRYTFPKLNFKATLGSTDALDSKGKEAEVFIPSMVMRNSYNKILSLNYSFWAIRQICTNGMMACKELQNISIKHTSVPDYNKIGGFITKQFDESIDFFKSLTNELSSKDGFKLLENLTMAQGLGKKIEGKILNKMTGLISYEYNDEDKLVGIDQIKPFSKYLVFNAATEVFSHEVKQFHQQAQLQTKLMKAIAVSA